MPQRGQPVAARRPRTGPARRPPEVARGGPARARVLQVVGEQPGAGLGHPVRVDVVAGERADQGEPVLRPGGGHVQPALAAVAQQRSPLVAHPAVGVLAVPDRQDDRVPLVALHPLEVLDEERLRPSSAKNARLSASRLAGHRRSAGAGARPRARPQAIDRSACLMPSAITPSDSPGPAPRVLEDQLDDLLTSAVTETSWPGSGPWPTTTCRRQSSRSHAGERGQRAAVDVGVGERDEALVPAPVMPGQRAGRQQRAERVEHGLEAGAERDEVLVLVVVVSSSPSVDLAEEVGRRQLPVVAGHHDLMAAHDRAGIASAGHDLAGLVEDHDVEQPGRAAGPG